MMQYAHAIKPVKLTYKKPKLIAWSEVIIALKSDFV